MAVRHIVRAQLRELAIHFIHRDRAALDIDQTMRIAPEISDEAVLGVNSNAVAIGIFPGRGDDRAHWNVLEFSDAAQNIVNLVRFSLELVRVSDVLICATTTTSEVRAGRINSMRRTLSKIDNLRFSELLFLANNFRRDQFAVDCERNENRFAIVARNSFSAESDVLDFKIDRAHRQR